MIHAWLFDWGDSLENDILPAAGLGIQTFWLAGTPEMAVPDGTVLIRRMHELLPGFVGNG